MIFLLPPSAGADVLSGTVMRNCTLTPSTKIALARGLLFQDQLTEHYGWFKPCETKEKLHWDQCWWRVQSCGASLYLCNIHDLDGRQLSCFDMSALRGEKIYISHRSQSHWKHPFKVIILVNNEFRWTEKRNFTFFVWTPHWLFERTTTCSALTYIFTSSPSLPFLPVSMLSEQNPANRSLTPILGPYINIPTLLCSLQAPLFFCGSPHFPFTCSIHLSVLPFSLT